MKKIAASLSAFYFLAAGASCFAPPAPYVPGPPVALEASDITAFCEYFSKCGNHQDMDFNTCVTNYKNLTTDPTCGNAMAAVVKCALNGIGAGQDMCYLDKSSCRAEMDNSVKCSLQNIEFTVNR